MTWNQIGEKINRAPLKNTKAKLIEMESTMDGSANAIRVSIINDHAQPTKKVYRESTAHNYTMREAHQQPYYRLHDVFSNLKWKQAAVPQPLLEDLVKKSFCFTNEALRCEFHISEIFLLKWTSNLAFSRTSLALTKALPMCRKSSEKCENLTHSETKINSSNIFHSKETNSANTDQNGTILYGMYRWN